MDGTSAATPVTAAVFAKLNDIRFKAGKPSLGFLNPFIYKNNKAFNDVTTGCNNGGSKYGFTAAEEMGPCHVVGHTKLRIALETRVSTISDN